MTKRPWHRDSTLLGIKFGAKSSPTSSDSIIGWWLFKTRPNIIDEGTRYLLAEAPNITHHLSPAEYQTVREDCGLSRDEAAQFHEVEPKTIKQWERFKGRVPDGAAAEISGLREKLERASEAATDTFHEQLENHSELDGVTIYKYQPESYLNSKPCAEGLPHGAHNRLLALTVEKLASDGVRVAIEYANLT